MAGDTSGYFRVAVISHNGNFVLNQTSNGSLEIVGGYEAHFLDMLSKGLRLQPVIYTSEDGEWGRVMEDGNWTGLVGMVLRGEVDMAISGLLITEGRRKAGDFSYPYSIEDVTFATQKPGSVPTAAALIKPFSLDLWIGIFASLAVFSLVFYFLMSKKSSFHRIAFTLLGYILNQSSDMSTQKLTDRFLIGAWLCGTVFLSKIYSSFLLSYLTLPIKEDGIKDVSQLAKAVAGGTFKCYTTRGSSLLEGLAASEQEHTKTIIAAIIKNDWLLNPKESNFEKFVLRKQTALIRTRKFMGNLFQDDVFVSDDYFYSAYAAVILPKNSPFKPQINNVIHRIAASGVYAKSLEQYLFQKTLIKNSRKILENNDFDQIALEDMKGAFLFLILGNLLAAVVCLIEILCNLMRRRNSNTPMKTNDLNKGGSIQLAVLNTSSE